jgi:hypothetical protein
MAALDAVGALAAEALALSLATERIVTTIKTMAPQSWFAPPDDAYLKLIKDPASDWARRVRVQALSFGVALLGACFMTTDGSGLSRVIANIELAGTAGFAIPVWIFAFLATGGSAFWTNILGITSIMKDLQSQQRTSAAAAVQKQIPRAAIPDRAATLTAATVAPAFRGT